MGLLPRGGRGRERGFALSAPVTLLSAGAVVLAGIAFFSTDGPDKGPAAAAVGAASRPSASASASASATPTRTAAPKVIKEKKQRKPPVRRAGVYVEVYNNSGISGLAGETAARASGAGWEVVGSDNWYGTIPASTVYYPERLAGEARLLARDLGITRLQPSIAPMRGDRLTVILTADFA